MQLGLKNKIADQEILQSQNHKTKFSGVSAPASPFTIVEKNESPSRAGDIPKPHRDVMVGLGLATRFTCCVSSRRA